MRNPFKGLLKSSSDPGLNLRNSLPSDAPRSANLFGSIANNAILPGGFDFFPFDDKGGIIRSDGSGFNKEAVWLGLSNKNMQFWAYNYCSPLAAVIDRLAEADSNGILEFINDDGTTIKNPNKNPQLKRIKNLFDKPNPLQTNEEWNSQLIVLAKIFGYCPVFCISPFGMDKSYTKYMFNLNPYLCNPIRNTNYSLYGNTNGEDGKWDGVDRVNPIKEWQFTIHGTTYHIPSEDILLVKDGFIDAAIPDMGLPISKVAGLDFFVSNICAAMEADNVLLKKKGPLGVFSADSKSDMAGLTPMPNEQNDDLQDQLKRYGLTHDLLQYVVSKWPIKWNAMSFNLRDLMTKETIRSGIDGICDRFGYPAELMSGKNATYENRSSAEKFLYQNNIIPFSLRRMARFNMFFGLSDIGIQMTMDYDHLPVLQEDIQHAGEAFNKLSGGLDILWKDGLLTFNQVLMKLEMDTISGMDIYYPEWLKNNPEMQNQKQDATKQTPTP